MIAVQNWGHCNLATPDAEAGGSQIEGQLEPLSETPFQNKKSKEG